MISLDPVTWITAIMMLFVYSHLLIGHNPMFKLAEHIYVGITAGFLVVMAVQTLNSMAVVPLAQGEVGWAIVLVFGLLIYARFSKKYMWVSRWPVAFVVGIGTAVAVRTMIRAQVIAQIVGASIPLIAPTATETVNNWIMIVATVTVLLYFFFTFEKIQKSRGFEQTRRVGRYFMVVALGASFGATFITALIMLVERILWLMSKWLGVV